MGLTLSSEKRMKNNATVSCLILCLLFLACVSGGCATLSFRQGRSQDRLQEGVRGRGKSYRLIPLRDSENPRIIYSYIVIEDESYFDILNKQSQERIRDTQFYNKWSQIRHIGFFGRLTEYEKEFGAKLVFPW